MKKSMLAICLLLVGFMIGVAQNEETKPVVKYGYFSYEGLLKELPEYQTIQNQLKSLESKLEDETKRNESEFQRLFSDFLSGQKDFPQTIMLKRQKELQDLMDKSIAFRQSSLLLLQQAQKEMMAPLETKIQTAIENLAKEKQLELIINKDEKAILFCQPALSENIQPLLLQLLSTNTEVPAQN